MGRIEKTVFISYRRTNFPWALAVYQDLIHHDFDVFLDYQSIDSEDFEKIILDNIKARAHFIVVITPSALDRCKEPNDWLRREIETAIDEKRNIVPLMMDGFDFGSSLLSQALTGKIAALSGKNGLPIYADYFFEGMEKLRNRYLNVALEDVPLYVLSEETKVITESQKIATSEAKVVQQEALQAQKWFERGYVFQKEENFDEAIRCYTEATLLKPNFAEAYSLLGFARANKGDLDEAIEDFTEAIRIEPDYADLYVLRTVGYEAKKDYHGAIADYEKYLFLGGSNEKKVEDFIRKLKKKLG